MNKLTDLELCKKVAEIERVDFVMTNDGKSINHKVYGIYCGNEYNPLTNKALLFDLMVKYKVEIDYMRPADCSIFTYDTMECLIEIEVGESLPRAILECIVESKNE